MQMLSAPIVKELVLLGGGHSHVEVLRSWGMKPVAGVRLTLITRDMHTPYSGMLPGYVSGFYSYDECHIDLCRLATFARARLIHAEANGIDIKARHVFVPGRPLVCYDVLSIDIGITPAAVTVPGAAQHTTTVKPIDKFVSRFDGLLSRIRTSAHPLVIAVVGGGAGGVELAMAVNHRMRQERQQQQNDWQQRQEHGKCTLPAPGADTVKLFCRGSILSGHTHGAASAVRSICETQGIQLHQQSTVTAVEGGRLQLADGVWHLFDECLWCTQAAAAQWVKQTGLTTDDQGFLLIDEYLQSCGGPGDVFACGDVATSSTHPRPKAGVYAVRQGPPLTANLRAHLTGQPLTPFTPQDKALALITTGNKYAVGTRGWLTFQGAWAWSWKDYIDRKFMDKYGTDLPFDNMKTAQNTISSSSSVSNSSSSWWHWISSLAGWGAAAGQQQQQLLPGVYQAAGPEAAAVLAAAAMRCGGCGSKVGSSTLERVLKKVKLQQQQHGWQQQQQQQKTGSGKPVQAAVNVLASASAAAAGGDSPAPPAHSHNHNTSSDQITKLVTTAGSSAAYSTSSSSSSVLLGVGDDAAVVAGPPAGHVMVSTIDYFKTFWADSFVLGAIAANHALGDCYAMGAHPSSALALAVVPHGSSSYQESELTDMLTGAVGVLSEAGCEMVGGHSSEGVETAVGLSITGHIAPVDLMTKGGLASGDVLVLSKALGTGTIMAAAMRGQVKGRWVSSCLSSMQVSSAAASNILRSHGCRAATDVTGFGLLGHAVEMARASKVQIQLSLSAIPVLPGALYCLSRDITSTLHNSNTKAATAALTSSNNSSSWSSDDARCMLLCDPQTAGGLLAGVAAADGAAVVEELRAVGYLDACIVGRVLGCVGSGAGAVEVTDLVQLVDCLDVAYA